ncbi:MAG: DUF3482 domain-containing protein [Pontibacterium sp.]
MINNSASVGAGPQEANNTPVLAVVGHPNKGKSSIVSTLTRQPEVAISELSGTTTKAQGFDFSLNGETYYTLIDTPGFQRPRRLLSWLMSQEVNAAQRKARIAEFVDEQRKLSQEGSSRFNDEVELLTPILAGAGIVYVVDGSLPYTEDLEAEMTILQWTGQPRMALINPIAGDAYVEQWQAALEQYFSVVRVFNPMDASLDSQMGVLRAFAELSEPWRRQLQATLTALEHHWLQQRQQAARRVAELLVDMLSHQTRLKVPVAFVEDQLESKLKADYQNALRQKETALVRQLQGVFDHASVDTFVDALDTQHPDLFDTTQWFAFGLDRTKLVALSASAGVAAGAVLDAGVGGASFMTGAIAGGLVSGLASFAATLKPEKLKFKGVPVAGKELVAGPSKSLNFNFVVLGRALDVLEHLLSRTHANRAVGTLAPKSMTERLSALSKTEQVKLTRLLQKSAKGLSEQELTQFSELILTLVTAKPLQTT